MGEIASYRSLTALALGIVLIGGVVAFSTPAAAHSGHATLTCEEKTHEVNVDTATKLYNNNTDAIPSPIASVLGANQTEIQIDNATQKYYTVQTASDMTITDVELGQSESPDIIVKTNRDTACSLYTASNPVKTFETAYSNDEIKVKATDPVGSAKVFVVEKVVDVLNMF